MPKIPHINARAETVHKKPLFREAFAKRRALIPATGFFEWQKRADGKQPYRFRREDLEPFAFAGLWEFARIGDKEILSAAIIVGEPNPLAAAVHDRMPVILDPEDYDRWLDPDDAGRGAAGAAEALSGRAHAGRGGEPRRQQREERQRGMHRADRRAAASGVEAAAAYSRRHSRGMSRYLPEWAIVSLSRGIQAAEKGRRACPII